MMDFLPFSVSMCVYGGDDPNHFQTAVESVLHQTVKPAEVVIVVDGPIPPALERVVAGFEKLPIFRIVRLEENKGHGVARRTSLAHCTYDVVALMDADDISVPTRFEKQLAVLSGDESLSIVGGNIAEFIGTEENVVGYREVPPTDREIKEYLKTRCPMNQVTVMFRKQDVQDVGGYVDWYCEEDYYLWLRMHLAGMRFANVAETLVNVRIGEDMYRRRGGTKYFISEWKLQRYMLRNRVIGVPTYCVNVCKRLIVQVLLPNRVRGWVFRKFARN